VYFKTSGWIERGGTAELSQGMLEQQGLALSRAELVAKYGEENADFLESELHRYKTRYTQFTFIEMGSSRTTASSGAPSRRPTSAAGATRRCGAAWS
jgi:hypothetical protein